MSLLYTSPSLAKCGERKENDVYPTPWKLVKATIDVLATIVEFEPKTILDIGCGDGLYCKYAKEIWPNAHTTGYDVVDRRKRALTPNNGTKWHEVNKDVSGVDTFILEDYLTTPAINKYDLIIGNIPYSIAEKLLTKAWAELNDGGIMQELLLLNFISSQGRSPYNNGFFAKTNLLKMVVCSKRPSFTGNGKTDAREYANFIWQKGYNGPATIDWMQW